MKKLLNIVVKFAILLFGFVFFTIMSYQLLPVKRLPKDDFLVCVLNERKNPMIVYFNEINNQIPCDNLSYDLAISDLDTLVKLMPNNEWQIHLFHGDFTDPVIYHYAIYENQIIPLWYSHEKGLQRLLEAIIIGFVSTLLIYRYIIK